MVLASRTFSLDGALVRKDGQIDEEAVGAAVSEQSQSDPRPAADIPPPVPAFQAARQYLEQKAELWDWDDDIEFLGLSWVEFI